MQGEMFSVNFKLNNFSLLSNFASDDLAHNFFKIKSNSKFVPVSKNLFNLLQNSEKSALIPCTSAEK